MKFYKFEGNKEVYPLFAGEIPAGAVEVAANKTEAAFEKHIPDLHKVEGGLEVCVGSVAHPMLDVHYIEWILLVNGSEIKVKTLKPGEEPKACFEVEKYEEGAEVFAFCNLHGLWSKVVE
ncbi:MAG: desulfoferrodoxin [Bacilli bacterium]|nr:desulfoferrodoxin [Bacilli bacterium]